MKEIIELNSRIMEEAEGAIPKDGLLLCRESDWENVQLPVNLRCEMEAVRERLNRCVPDDFAFEIHFGRDETFSFGLIYRDGPQITAIICISFVVEVSIFEQLERQDWDSHRRKAISGSQGVDQLRQKFAQIRTRLPATDMFQRMFRSSVEKFIEENRSFTDKIHVLMFNGVGLRADTWETLDELKRLLPLCMRLGGHLVAVIVEGKPLEAWRIDAMKWDAYNSLKGMPMAQAEASGKVRAWEAGCLNLSNV